MFALAAAIILFLYALHIRPETVDFLTLGLALWALHFAFAIALPAVGVRRDP